LQVDIKDIGVFQTTLKQISSLKDRITQKINFMSNELQKKQSEIEGELRISENLLNVAKAYEIQKQTILAQKTAQLARALRQEAAALTSGNPVVIAAATAYVAKATHEEMIAQQEYQKTRENRINMQRRVELIKKAKHQIDTLYEQTKIQLNGLNLYLEELTQILYRRLTKGDLFQKDYLSQNINNTKNDREYKNIPKSGGVWRGEPGNSKWIPNRDETPKQPYGNEKTWGEILDENGIDGIYFKDGEPDFTPVSKANVKIKDFTTNRDDNFYQADQKLAQQWNQENKDGKNDWLISDIRKYRKEKKLTWHERSDMKNMDLVSQEIHANVPHTGGISKKKKLELEQEDD
jgi:hypothetical protein